MEREFYYIIFDTEFGSLNKSGNERFQNINVFGKLRHEQQNNKFIPVLFDENDAKSVARRMVDKAATFGNIESHVDPNKHVYPVFGAIIVKAKLNNDNFKIVDNKLENGKVANYRSLFSEGNNADLIIYNATMPNGSDNIPVKRGLLLNGAKFTVTELGYLIKTTVDTHVGFCLLNLNSNLSALDVRKLKVLYGIDKDELTFVSQTQINHALKLDNQIKIPIETNFQQAKKISDPEYRHMDQLGGNDSEMKKLYKQEKTKYLALKAAEKQGVDIKGGAVDWEKLYKAEKAKYLQNKYAKNNNWEELYKTTKAKYLAMKDANKMTGGNPFKTINNTVTKQETPETEKWEKLYKEKKLEYLAMKTAKEQGYNMTGGSVNWEQLYKTEKAKYLQAKYGDDANWEQLYKAEKSKYLASKK